MTEWSNVSYLKYDVPFRYHRFESYFIRSSFRASFVTDNVPYKELISKYQWLCFFTPLYIGRG